MVCKNILQKIVPLFILLFLTDCLFAEEDPEPKDTLPRDVFKWEYNATHTQRNRVLIDTTSDFFFLHEPNGSIADYHVDVAGYASPAFSLLYKPREKEPMFLRAYGTALLSTSEMADYTTQHPFSELSYSGGLKGEQSGRLFHTQNVNKYLNLGFNMKFYKMLGEFDNQNIKGQHVAPWISYYGPRFSTIFKYSFNNIKRGENGGIAADSLLNYEKLLRMKYPNAYSSMRVQDISFVQKWNLGKKPKEDSASLELPLYKAAAGYRLDFVSAKRNFNDKHPDTTFYPNVFYDSTKTNDSLVFKKMQNSVFLEFQRNMRKLKLAANFDFGIEYQSLSYYDYDYKLPEYFFHSEFYQGAFDASFARNFKISHQHCIYFAGEDKGDMSFTTAATKFFNIRNQRLTIGVYHSFSKESPHCTYLDYETNSHVWHGNFLAEKKNDMRVFAESTFGNLSVDVHYYLLKNYVSFDEAGSVWQSLQNGTAYTCAISKKTEYKYFLMTNGVVLQNVSVGDQEYPNFATYNSAAFRFAIFRKLLQFSIGGEVLYYPKYKVPVYDGMIGDFLPQSEYEYGSFPLVNVFATVKYKPIRLFVKYTNLYALLKEQNFPVAGYPQDKGNLSFGLTWLFKN